MHKSRKRFGQNFLIDSNIINHIIQAIDPKPSECLVEIGPGLGAITKPLLTMSQKLHVIELDRDLVPLLASACRTIGDLIIHQADVLEFDFTQLCPKQKLTIVGNLPYNISTPLIFHLLKYRSHIKTMFFMLQKEVVERMVAEPGSKTYGRLSIMVQYYCQTQSLFTIDPTAFDPIPKVDSAFIKLIPHTTLPYPAKNEVQFAQIVREAFNHRRKTIHNSLKKLLSDEVLIKANINPQHRAEQLSIEDFVRLANFASNEKNIES